MRIILTTTFINLWFTVSLIGQTYFNKTYDGVGFSERGDAVIAEPSRYVLAGNQSHEEGAFIVSKPGIKFIDFLGAVTHSETYFGGFEFGYDVADLIRTNDDGYLIACTFVKTDPRQFIGLLKYSSSGVFEWFVEHDIGEGDDVREIVELANGSLVLVGTTRINNSNTLGLILKTDDQGMELWHETYGNTTDTYNFWGIEKTDDNGFLLAGFRRPDINSFFKAYIIKIDSEGNQEWDKWYVDDEGSAIYDILKLDDGNYLLSGPIVIEVFTPFPLVSVDQDGLVRKINSNGDIIWDKTYGQSFGGDIEYFDTFFSGIELLNGETVFVGTRQGSEIGWSIKLDIQGDKIWERIYESNSNFSNSFFDIDTTSDGGFIFMGEGRKPTGPIDQDWWVVKTDEYGCDTMSCEIFDAVENVTSANRFKLYPNPAFNHITVEFSEIASDLEIEIFNSMGRHWYSEMDRNSNGKCSISLLHLPKGVYTIRIVSDNRFHVTRTFIKL